MNAPARRLHPTRNDRRERRRPAPTDFERTVMPHRRELLASALRYTKDADAAEDLVQETLLRAFTAWSRFVPGSNCRAWLMRILTNSFINTYRRRKRHRRFVHETGDDAALALHGHDPEQRRNPHEILLQDALGDEVVAALNALREEHRAVVVRADLRGARYRDIAAELDLPVGTVMSRLFRARRQLESELADYAAADYGIRRAA